MSNNYNKSTRFFNTGFLPDYADKLRIQQGLPSQKFANMCAYNSNGKSSGLAGTPIKMYPTLVTPLPKPCPCPCDSVG